MMINAIRLNSSRAKLGFAILCFGMIASPTPGQDELHPIRKIAFQTAHGFLALQKGPNDTYYALNRDDNCIWIFIPTGGAAGCISGETFEPNGRQKLNDLAIDHNGNLIVAAGGVINVLFPSGKTSNSFVTRQSEHVGVLSDGRIVASGFPQEQLLSLFDQNGTRLCDLGTPVKVVENPQFNGRWNSGEIAIDSDDNIYYVFRYLPSPTIRKYDPAGQLLAEWHPEDGAEIARAAEISKDLLEQDKKDGKQMMSRVFDAAAFDRTTNTLWVASRSQLTQFDTSGRILRKALLFLPDGTPFHPNGLLLDRENIFAGSEVTGVFVYQKPE